MTGARASLTRPTLVLALCGVLAFMAIGCGDDDDTTVTFPEQPEQEIGLWFLGIWGSGPDDIFIVGQPGLIFHWDGTAWSQENSGTTVALTDVWGSGDGTVYATGHDGVILRRQGTTWSAMNTGSDADFFSVGSFQDVLYACGRTDSMATLRRLEGSSWVAAGREIFLRDNQQAVTDTFYLDTADDPEEVIESLTSVGYHGITGSDGIILMDDPETDWQLRRVKGGAEWVTCSAGGERISNNFIATDGGRLFQLTAAEGGRLGWTERFSPALDSVIYGLHVDEADTVWAVTNDGRINRVDPPAYNSMQPLYADGKILFDIWGSSGTDLYAVGIEGRVLHFSEVAGEHQWVELELPLPETKHHAQPVFDKFGRPAR